MDVTNVPSKRRNPVIADLFQRLKLVERRGSGLKKIRKEYDSSDRQPVFFSDESWFITTLYNLNYGVDADAEADVTKNVPIDVPMNVPKEEERRQRIIDLINSHEGITATHLSKIMDVARKTITRDLERLTSAGIIIRVGGKRFGRWEVLKNENNRENQ